MKHKPLERNVISRAIKVLNSLPQTYVRKVHGNAQNAGWPDLVGCCRGHMLALEGKREDGRLSALQEAELARWEATDAVSGVFTKVEDIIVLLVDRGLFSKSELARIALQKKK